MLNTHQLIVMFFMIGSIQALLITDAFDTDLSQFREQMENDTVNYAGQSDTVLGMGSDSSYQQGEESFDRTPGSTYLAGAMLWDMFKTVMWRMPTSIARFLFTKNSIDKVLIFPVALALQFFQMLMLFFGAMLVYDKYKNRKVG